jgi:Tat protein secretion system quality control protein TatD with DNase activity
MNTKTTMLLGSPFTDNQGLLSIYINVRPKRRHINRSFWAMKALERQSKVRKLGHTFSGVHEVIGIHPNFVLSIAFASQEDKDLYEQDNIYKYHLRQLKHYSKHGGFKLLRD